MVKDGHTGISVTGTLCEKGVLLLDREHPLQPPGKTS